MSIANEITRIKQAKVSIRDVLANKNIDIPSSNRINTYYLFLDTLGDYINPNSNEP